MIEFNIAALLNEWVSAFISGFISIWVVVKSSLAIVDSIQRMLVAFQLSSLTGRFRVFCILAIEINYNAHSKHPWMAKTYIETFFPKEVVR